MINLFAVPSTDQSIYYLGQIFGFVGNVLPVSSAPMILGVMFKTFNTMVLSVAALIVLYVTIVGIMKTAQEGEFLGKNWNSLWVPIRMVIGIASLVPSPSGYCAIQIVVMWIIVQGIGAADVLWRTVLVYSDVAGSPVAQVGVPGVGISPQMRLLFQSLTCQETAHLNSSYPDTGVGSYYCSGRSSAFCNSSASQYRNISGDQSMSVGAQPKVMAGFSPSDYTKIYKIGPEGKCGALAYCDAQLACTYPVGPGQQNTSARKILCDACNAQKDTLQQSVDTLSKIAAQFASADLSFRLWAANKAEAPEGVLAYCRAKGISEDGCCIRPLTLTPFSPNAQELQKCQISAGTFPQNGDTAADLNNTTVTNLLWPYLIKPNLGESSNFINVVANNYVSTISAVLMEALGNQSTVIQSDILREASESGWIFAGAYYYQLAQSNDKLRGNTLPVLAVQAGSGLGSGYRSNYTAASYLASATVAGRTDAFSSSMPPELSSLSQLSDQANSSAQWLMNGLMGMMGSEGAGQRQTNPLASLQSIGSTILVVAQVLFGIMMIVILPLALIGNITPSVLGTFITNPIGPTLTTLVVILAPLIMLVMGALFIFGATLAIYVPLIPYMVYVMGVIAWFILVIEAMIAAPIVALGILSPSGHHEILGKSEQALLLLFGIFLRPSLMVFGLMAAMLLAIVVVTMINASFAGVTASIYQNPGLLEAILFLCAYVGIVIAALNKCFSLIHVIPDQVLRWIGHAGGREGGEGVSEMLGGAKGGVTSGAGVAKSGVGASQEGAKAGGEMAKGIRGAQKKAKQPGGPSIESTKPKKGEE